MSRVSASSCTFRGNDLGSSKNEALAFLRSAGGPLDFLMVPKSTTFAQSQSKIIKGCSERRIGKNMISGRKFDAKMVDFEKQKQAFRIILVVVI